MWFIGGGLIGVLPSGGVTAYADGERVHHAKAVSIQVYQHQIGVNWSGNTAFGNTNLAIQELFQWQ